MHARQDPPVRLQLLAQLQGGVVTREQASGLGLCRRAIDRLVAAGQWQRLAPGVHLTHALPPTWTSWAWAGVLLGGDLSRVGGAAAAHLHGLAPQPSELCVLVPHGAHRPRPVGPLFFRQDARTDRRARGLPPRLNVEDTVLDLASELGERALVGLVTDAVQRRLTTPQGLQTALAGRRSVAQRRLLTSLLEEVTVGVRSVLERTYLRDVERAHGLPVGHRQVARRGTEADVLYDEFTLLVELDGRLGHQGSGRFRDLGRDNVATVDGLATLRYGHHDVHGDPCAVAFQVAAVLSGRGWRGDLRRCQRCRRVT